MRKKQCLRLPRPAMSVLIFWGTLLIQPWYLLQCSKVRDNSASEVLEDHLNDMARDMWHSCRALVSEEYFCSVSRCFMWGLISLLLIWSLLWEDRIPIRTDTYACYIGPLYNQVLNVGYIFFRIFLSKSTACMLCKLGPLYKQALNVGFVSLSISLRNSIACTVYCKWSWMSLPDSCHQSGGHYL